MRPRRSSGVTLVRDPQRTPDDCYDDVTGTFVEARSLWLYEPGNHPHTALLAPVADPRGRLSGRDLGAVIDQWVARTRALLGRVVMRDGRLEVRTWQMPAPEQVDRVAARLFEHGSRVTCWVSAFDGDSKLCDATLTQGDAPGKVVTSDG